MKLTKLFSRVAAAAVVFAAPLGLAAGPAGADHGNLAPNLVRTTASEYIVPLGTIVTITSSQLFVEEITILRTISPTAGQYINNCTSALSCSANVSSPVPVTHEYFGQNAHFASNRVSVTWVDTNNPSNVPSATCVSPVTDTTLLGTSIKVTNTVTASEVSLCARVNTAVARAGGKLTVTLPHDVIDIDSLPVPTTDSAPVSSCATEPGNLLPIHPVFQTTTLGQTIVIDAYASASKLWICIRTDDGDVRIVQPIGLPSGTVLPGFSVNFYPDPS